MLMNRHGSLLGLSKSWDTPPGMKASPVFSRVSRIHDNRRIYLSGLYGEEAGDGAAQVTSIFSTSCSTLPDA